MLSARSSSVRKRLGNVENIDVEYIEASGDCFYLAMEAALSEGEGWCPYYAVATQRDVVASSMSEETYQMYALMYQQQAEGECSNETQANALGTFDPHVPLSLRAPLRPALAYGRASRSRTNSP